VHLQLHTAIEVEATPERVFDYLSAPDVFTRVLRSLGPIPGVTSSELLGGATALASGVRRRVHLTDGTSLEEHVIDHDRPGRQSYRWGHPPKGPFGMLIRGAEADWRFAAHGSGTRVVWDYDFELTSPLIAPLAMLVLALFKRWMQRGLVEVQKGVGAL
jgi:carbon monoxide dehydrogenase subunit G